VAHKKDLALVKLFTQSYESLRAKAVGATPAQMRDYSRAQEIPNRRGIMVYYTHKTGRSKRQTIDNVHYTTGEQKRTIEGELAAVVRYVTGKRTQAEKQAEWIVADRYLNILSPPSASELRAAIAHENADKLFALSHEISVVPYNSNELRRDALFQLRKTAIRIRNSSGASMVAEERSIARHPKHSYAAEVACTRDYARLALAFHNNFFPPSGKRVSIRLAFVPEWQNTLVMFEPFGNVTIGLGVDYAGEVKKGCMRAAQHAFTTAGLGVGVHMGSKVFGRKGALFAGLSGTGKTTVSLYLHPRWDGEVHFKQDDMLFLTWRGEAIGMENQFYIKTDTITEKYQRALLDAVMTDEQAMVENVRVKDGELDFTDLGFCPNGRAFVRRSNIPGTADDPDINRVDVVFFLTRGDFPPMQKVEGDQAASFFALGESVKRAGTEVGVVGEVPVRTIGFDPFTIDGYHADRVDAMRRWIKRNPGVEFVVLNTGSVGGKKIPPEETFRMVEAVMRGEVKWRKDEWARTLVGEWPGFDARQLHSGGEYEGYCKRFNADRKAYLRKEFPGQRWLWAWLEGKPF
jgi:phosphoenolpyruvate carboxykinase (ATP)